ncbi:MAG: hypothetical protein KDJ78_00195 [Rhodobacteraceae bacterium]|uniref:glycine-rich domain-containing protein n=1 Tax=Amaricoccus sp. TaxID=1872485 RepID=UPI001D4ECB82|nr:hypothetical protein [Amaricoccus sp.]MCB1372598.1 hypothetical protein [Paracoccaceae bacterium]MCB1401322.1 hypothetical protein [Paracoccaceae bacterium]HRW16480.1 hypothetical protein [Amaricoccus sp.]
MLDIHEALIRVSQIDLSPVSRVLKYEKPEFWTDEVLAETEASYRNLLVLNLLYPDRDIVVNKILDDYWHQHILDTRKYAEDCEMVFGHFLHHDPYFGISGDEDLQANREAFGATQALWQEVFGTPMIPETSLTLDKVLGSYDQMPRDVGKNRVYAFPQTCKCGQHCNKTIVPETRINPQISPQINPQINPQIRTPFNPQELPTIR